MTLKAGDTAPDFTLPDHHGEPQTLSKLLEWRVVPVINENDTTATDEISFGNNDFLAAQVAILLGAELLLLLTDAGGVYTGDPRTDPGATLIGAADQNIRFRRRGSGRLASFLQCWRF